MGWAFLPPIQRQLAGPISRLSVEFSPGSWQSPGFTGDLSHAVSDRVQGGVVDGDGAGLGHPSETRTPAPEMPLLPPPRPTAQRDTQRPTAEWSTVQRLTAGPTAPGDAPPPVAAPRSMVRADPEGLPLASPPVVPEPSHPEQVTEAGHPEPAPDTTEAPVEAAEPADAVGDPPQSGDDGDDHEPPAAVQRSVGPEPAGSADPPSRPRLGLGPPLPQVPESAVREPGVPPSHAGHSEIPIPSAPPRPVAPSRGGDRPNVQRAATPATPAAPETPAGKPQPAPAMPVAPSGTPPRTPGDEVPTAPTDAVPDAEPPSEPSEAATDESPVPEPASPTAPEPDAVPTADAAAQPAQLVAEPVTTQADADEAASEAAAQAVAVQPAEGPAAASPARIDDETTGPGISGVVSSTPLPLATGMSTSLQRSSVLPGPGQPTPALRVTAAGAPTARPARVVPVQRIPADPPSPPSPPSPPTSPPAGQAPVARESRGGRWWSRRVAKGESATVQRTAAPQSPPSAAPVQRSRHAALASSGDYSTTGEGSHSTTGEGGSSTTGEDAGSSAEIDAGRVAPARDERARIETPTPSSSPPAAPVQRSRHAALGSRHAALASSGGYSTTEGAYSTTGESGDTADVPAGRVSPVRDERARVETPLPVQRSREPDAGPVPLPDDGDITGLPVVPAAPSPPSGPTLALPATPNGSQPAALAVQRLGLGDLSSAASSVSDTASDVGSAVSDARDTATSAADQVGGLVDTGRGLVDTATDAAKGAIGESGQPTGGGGAGDDEELARRLFRPILRMLRSELLVDRERRGMRTDRW